MPKRILHDTDFDGNKIVSTGTNVPLVVAQPTDPGTAGPPPVANLGTLTVRSRGPIIAIGMNAGEQFTATAGGTVFIGTRAGQNFVDPWENVAIGVNAQQDATGKGSVTIGSSAGAQNSGANLAAYGKWAGLRNRGADVVAIGGSAAMDNTGDRVIAIGANAASTNTQNDVVQIGDDARAFKLAIGNSGFGAAGKMLKVNAAGTGMEWGDAPSGLPTGGADWQVVTKVPAFMDPTGVIWSTPRYVPAPMAAGPAPTTAGQVLTVNAANNGYEWKTPASGLPALGSAGQVLTVNAGATAAVWQAPAVPPLVHVGATAPVDPATIVWIRTP